MTTLILSDFDGTMTDMPGELVVNSPFYKSLQMDANSNYNDALFKTSVELQTMFEQYFKSTASDEKNPWLMKATTVNVLKKLLANPLIFVVIITKNRSDYIQALCKYQGFNAEEISQLLILSTIETNLIKAQLVDKYLSFQAIASIDKIYLLEDTAKDYLSMNQVLNRYAPLNKIIGHWAFAGHFDWLSIFQDLID